jgi:hypothetical protein
MKYSALEQQYVLSNGRKVERIEFLLHRGKMPIHIQSYPYGQFSMNIANYPYGELHPLEKVELANWLIMVLADWGNPTPEHEQQEQSASGLLRLN